MADRSILILGAGKIGRSFIGQLFGKAGYAVVFVDQDRSLVSLLNRRGSYPVIIKGPGEDQRLVIDNVRAVHTSETDRVKRCMAEACIMAVSVGKSALPLVAPLVAAGMLEREEQNPGRTLDIILAENMRAADLYFRERLRENLPASYPLEKRIGLVETSIGKMVPTMSAADLQEDPLQVFAEAYNTLIVDRKGFIGRIPRVEELEAKDHMKAWVDRKAFIHNLGHASAAYSGYLRHPESVYMYQVLADRDVFQFTRAVMNQSAEILLKVYPGEFTRQDLSAHTDDLLNRFRNRNLGDTVFRVGSDLQRKLGHDDRFMGIIRMSIEADMPCDTILEAMAMGFRFRATDEKGSMLPADVAFHRAFAKNPEQVLENVCGMSRKEDQVLIREMKRFLEQQTMVDTDDLRNKK